MSDMGLSPALTARVVNSARKLVESTQRARDLLAQIDWSACDNADESEFDELSRMTYQGHPPCPFDDEATPEGRAHESEWCEPCQRNWNLRREWAAERKKRPNYIRAIERAFAAAKKGTKE